MSNLYDLTTEKLHRAVGIDVQNPRFAWKISSEKQNIFQESYRICLFDEDNDLAWDSGAVYTDEMCCVYDGAWLDFAADYRWELTARLSDGEELSADAYFMTGLMDAIDNIDAKWLCLPHKAPYTKESIPGFRKKINISENADDVKLFVSGSGVYEVFINGERIYDTDPAGKVSRFDLKPGFTEPLRRRLYHSYNATGMFKKGANCVSAIVGRGWGSDEIGARADFQEFLCVILIRHSDGTQEIVTTDGSWKVTDKTPVTLAEIWDGEDYNAGIPMDFAGADFDDSSWEWANESDYFAGELESMHGEPVVERTDLTRKPVKIYTFSGVKNAKAGTVETDPEKKITAESSETSRGDWESGVIDNVKYFDGPGFVLKKGETAVIDFAQNGSGRESFTVKGTKGTVINIRHGEMLNDRNGERLRGNDGPGGSVYLENMREARAATNYIIGETGREESFEPIFTFYGFRYVQITATEDVEFISIAAKTVTSVGYDSGNIITGDEKINRLFRNGRWGMYSNYVSIPTDCPQRDERLGWTADTQVFSTTAQYYSTGAQTFLEKWMQDMRDSQDTDGAYPSVAPLGPWKLGMGCMGWADAGIIVPYNVWKMTEDATIIEENWFSMRLYMDDFLARLGTAGPTPTYGDWLSFEPNNMELQIYLGVCYYAWDAMMMAEMAEVIGKPDAARHYSEIYQQEKNFFVATYVNEDGTVKLPQQTAALFALKLKLLPDERSYEAVKKQLVENFERTGYRLQTGFLGTSVLLPTLSDIGLGDIAYKLLFQEAMPSWLYSVNAGATTIWERWNSYSVENGFGNVGMNSFNHYAYGCVTEWMFAYMAGIRPNRYGFRKFVLAPLPDKKLGYCKASFDSACGKIVSEWEYKGEKPVYTFVIPANTTATVRLQGRDAFELSSGRYVIEA